jgi:hypothetical protein
MEPFAGWSVINIPLQTKNLQKAGYDKDSCKELKGSEVGGKWKISVEKRD